MLRTLICLTCRLPAANWILLILHIVAVKGKLPSVVYVLQHYHIQRL